MNTEALIGGLENIDANLSLQMKKINNMKNNINGRMFRICFCGVFKSGKSSLINNLLGVPNLLPTRVTTATAVVTEIKYADVPYAIAITDDNKKITIDIDNVGEYILAKHKTLHGVSSSDIKKVIIGIPSSVLENNIVFVDTPGLYDDVQLTKITTHQIEIADFAVVVYDAGKLMASGERSTLTILDTYLGNNFVTVVNKIDNVTEIQEIKDACLFYFKDCGYQVNDIGNVVFTSSNAKTLQIDDLKRYLKVINDKKDSVLRRSRIRSIKHYLMMFDNDLVESLQELTEQQKKENIIRHDDNQRKLQNEKQKKMELKIRLSNIVAIIPSIVEPFKQASVQIAMNERLFSSDNFQYELLSTCLLKTKAVFCQKFDHNIQKLLYEFNHNNANSFNPSINVNIDEFDECVSLASKNNSGLMRKMGTDMLGNKFYNQVAAKFSSSQNLVYVEGYSILVSRKFRMIEKEIKYYVNELDDKYANCNDLSSINTEYVNSNNVLSKYINIIEEAMEWSNEIAKRFIQVSKKEI